MNTPKKLTGAAKAAATKKAAADKLKAEREAPGAPRRSAANTGPVETVMASSERTAGAAGAPAPVVDEKGNTWPSWRYGPDGASKICASINDVPKGWKDHPGAFETGAEEPTLDL